jgi:phage virion morphogenesis protein
VIEVDTKQLRKLQRKLLALADTDFGPLLDAIGQQQEDSARRRIFETKRSPLGFKWAAWSERYARTRGPHHSLLRRTGAFGDSLTHVVDGMSVLIGSNLVYAETHLHGDPERNIPARPFLDISGRWQDPEDRAEILDEVEAFLEGLLQ